MGGMGFIENNKALCMLSVLINTHLLMAAQEAGVERFFYASSACVYAADKQTRSERHARLKEEDAYPAMPEDGYGWEKLFSERMCRHFREDFGMTTRVAALPQCLRTARHLGWRPRESAGRDLPQSDRRRSCRASTRSRSGETASRRGAFMYIDDCLKGTQMIMHSDHAEPLNLGSNELVTINELVDHRRGDRGRETEATLQPLARPKGVMAGTAITR